MTMRLTHPEMDPVMASTSRVTELLTRLLTTLERNPGQTLKITKDLISATAEVEVDLKTTVDSRDNQTEDSTDPLVVDPLIDLLIETWIDPMIVGSSETTIEVLTDKAIDMVADPIAAMNLLKTMTEQILLTKENLVVVTRNKKPVMISDRTAGGLKKLTQSIVVIVTLTEVLTKGGVILVDPREGGKNPTHHRHRFQKLERRFRRSGQN